MRCSPHCSSVLATIFGPHGSAQRSSSPIIANTSSFVISNRVLTCNNMLIASNETGLVGYS